MLGALLHRLPFHLTSDFRMHLRLAAFLLPALLSVPIAAQTPCLAAGDNGTFLDNVSMGGPNLLVAIRLQNGSSPLLVFAAEIFSGERAGVNTIGIWSHDPVNDRPLADLGTSPFELATPNEFQGQNLPGPVPIGANEVFWLVWGPTNGAQTSAEVANQQTGQPYRGSFDGGQNWNGPFINYDWKYRLWCHPIVPGRFTAVGTGCPGSGRTFPSLGITAIPKVGQNLSITVARAPANSNAICFLGFSTTTWMGQIALPFDLTGLGAPGCSVLVDLRAGAALTTDAAGAAALPVSVPNQRSLLGMQFAAQWVVTDPAANALGLITSGGGLATIGM